VSQNESSSFLSDAVIKPAKLKPALHSVAKGPEVRQNSIAPSRSCRRPAHETIALESRGIQRRLASGTRSVFSPIAANGSTDYPSAAKLHLQPGRGARPDRLVGEACPPRASEHTDDTGTLQEIALGDRRRSTPRGRPRLSSCMGTSAWVLVSSNVVVLRARSEDQLRCQSGNPRGRAWRPCLHPTVYCY
jgi:hypothetical protein